jgi:hypothetical protein
VRGLGNRVAEGVGHAHFSHLVSNRRVEERWREGREELMLKEISVLV